MLLDLFSCLWELHVNLDPQLIVEAFRIAIGWHVEVTGLNSTEGLHRAEQPAQCDQHRSLPRTIRAKHKRKPG